MRPIRAARNNENMGGRLDRPGGSSLLADTLIAVANVAVLAVVGLATLYLVLGLIRPRWAWATKRRSVVLRTFALLFLGLVGFAGAVGYAMTLPDSPHALDRYLKDFDWEELRKQDQAPPPQP